MAKNLLERAIQDGYTQLSGDGKTELPAPPLTTANVTMSLIALASKWSYTTECQMAAPI